MEPRPCRICQTQGAKLTVSDSGNWFWYRCRNEDCRAESILADNPEGALLMWQLREPIKAFRTKKEVEEIA